jgi:Domain of unknown function (DUF1707)
MRVKKASHRDRTTGPYYRREVSALLVSDRERDYTVGLLRAHWLAGRLTTEEFEERVGDALRARVAADLWQALRGLPVESPPVPSRQRESRGAVASIVVGILALCVLFMSFGLLFAVSLPLAVTAWALGREARRSGPPHRRDAAMAGEALGILGTVLSVLLFAGCAATLSGGL